MQEDRSLHVGITARLVGILYIIGTVSGVTSLTFIQAIRESEDILASVASSGNQLVYGAFCVLTMAIALAFIPILMFPILKRFNEALAIGYVVFRSALETMTYLLSIISWLLLIPLSNYAQDAASDAGLQELAATLFNTQAISTMVTLTFCISAFLFYGALFQFRLVPRWLSGWGFLAAIPYIIAGLLPLVGIIEAESSTQVTMFMPLAIQEMVLALWLVIRGFNSKAIAAIAV